MADSGHYWTSVLLTIMHPMADALHLPNSQRPPKHQNFQDKNLKNFLCTIILYSNIGPYTTNTIIFIKFQKIFQENLHSCGIWKLCTIHLKVCKTKDYRTSDEFGNNTLCNRLFIGNVECLCYVHFFFNRFDQH